MSHDEAFHATPHQIREAGEVVRRIAENLRSGLLTASQDVEGLSASWRGTAADDYQAGWNEVRDGGISVLDALQRLSDAYGTASTAYTEEDQGHAAALNGLRI